jgi:capsid portal protein
VSGYDYYGMPSNVACLPQQVLEYKAARYNLDEFDNNMVIGGVIVLQGNLTQEEANKLGKNIVQQHSGDGKRGRFAILSSENGIDNTKIEQFEKREDGNFIEYDKHISQKIIAANNWDPLLAGFSDGTGKLGNGGNAFIRSIYDIKQNTVIEPMQNYVIEKFLNPLFQICDGWMNTQFSKHDVGIKSKSPISFLGDITINAIVTVDEARQEFGMQPLPDGKGAGIVQQAVNKPTTTSGQNV